MLKLMHRTMWVPYDREQYPDLLLDLGLMDIGVGAFIFSSGISSRPAPLTRPYKGIVRSLERNGVLLILGEHPLCSPLLTYHISTAGFFFHCDQD